jgi:HEAT repeat protein
MDKRRNQGSNNAVQKLIEDLQHKDEKVRRYAAEDLGYEKNFLFMFGDSAALSNSFLSFS